MMDQFLEEVVVKHKTGPRTLMIVAANILMVLFALFAFIFLNTTINAVFAVGFSVELLLPLVTFLICLGGAVYLFINKDKMNTEYEYSFTNGTMDFAQVFNNKRRKALGTMNLRNLEACGMVSSGSFHRYISMPGIQRTHWFLNREADLMYLYFTKESTKRIIIIEPSEEMRKLIKGALSQGVWQEN